MRIAVMGTGGVGGYFGGLLAAARLPVAYRQALAAQKLVADIDGKNERKLTGLNDAPVLGLLVIYSGRQFHPFSGSHRIPMRGMDGSGLQDHSLRSHLLLHHLERLLGRASDKFLDIHGLTRQFIVHDS